MRYFIFKKNVSISFCGNRNILTVLFLAILQLSFSNISAQNIANANRSIAENVDILSLKHEVFKADILINSSINETLLKENFNVIEKAKYYELDLEKIGLLISNKPAIIELSIMTSDGLLHQLTMARYEILSDSYESFKGGRLAKESFEHDPGLHYRGIVKNEKDAWASFSIFNNGIQGIVASHTGNWVFAALKSTKNDQYIYYNDKDLKIEQEFQCLSPDSYPLSDIDPSDDEPSFKNSDKSSTDLCPIDVYWVLDYDFYVHSNQNILLAAYNILGYFNNVAAIYQAEDINVLLSEIFIYTTIDPYAWSDDWSNWLSFGAYIDTASNFDEDLAMLISLQFGGGSGVGVIDALCSTYDPSEWQEAGRHAVSTIDPFYDSVPTFSRSIYIISHEMGHNMGSRHTHWCGWVGGAIDDCAGFTEPIYDTSASCPLGPPPFNGGTIMSYCDRSVYGVVFVNGFGAQPGDEIRKDALKAKECACHPISVQESEYLPPELIIWPNPATSILHFSTGDLNIENVEFSIYDFFGRMIYNGPVIESMDISSYSSGIYMVKLTGNELLINQKFIVK